MDRGPAQALASEIMTQSDDAPDPPDVDRGEFFFPGSGLSVLLIHGLTGTPYEMRYLGERLAATGLRVHGMRGHQQERVEEPRPVRLAKVPAQSATQRRGGTGAADRTAHTRQPRGRGAKIFSSERARGDSHTPSFFIVPMIGAVSTDCRPGRPASLVVRYS